MDLPFESISDWLRTTVIGIVVLGALGSIVAVVIISALRKLVQNVIPTQRLKLFLLRSSRYYRDGYVLSALVSQDEVDSIIAYFAYRIVRIIFLIAAALAFFSLFLFLLARQTTTILTFGIYFSLVGAIVSAIFAYLEFWYIRLPFGRLIPELREEGEKSFVESLKDGSFLAELSGKQEDEAGDDA